MGTEVHADPMEGSGGRGQPPLSDPGVLAALAPLRELRWRHPVEVGLHAASIPCPPCDRMDSFARALLRSAPNLSLEFVAPAGLDQTGEAAPVPWLRFPEPSRIRFLGAPGSALSPAFAGLLTEAVQGPGPLDPALREVLRQILRRHHLRLFVSEQGPDSSPVLWALGRWVLHDERHLRLDVISVDQMPDLSRHFGVRTIPALRVDDFAHFYASPDPRELSGALRDVLPDGGWPATDSPGTGR